MSSVEIVNAYDRTAIGPRRRFETWLSRGIVHRTVLSQPAKICVDAVGEHFASTAMAIADRFLSIKACFRSISKELSAASTRPGGERYKTAMINYWNGVTEVS